jgi:hypothetical protein
MKLKTRIAPPNSIIFVLDPAHGFPPSISGYELITANRSCVAIETLCEMDGKTSIVLTDETKTQRKGTILAFNDSVETPTQEISIITSHNEKLLSIPTTSEFTAVQVWVNRKSEPDIIEVFVG